MTLYRTLAGALLAAALTAVPMAATAMTEPDDRATSTAGPQTTAEYAIPVEVEHMVILDRAQTDPRTGTPTLVDRDVHCDEGTVMDADPDDFSVELRVVESATETALNTEGQDIAEFRGGDILRGRLCESLTPYELVLRDGLVFGGSLAYIDLAPYWTDGQVQALVDGHGARAWANGDGLARPELYAQPGIEGEILTTPAPGTEVRVGLPYRSTRTATGLVSGTESWVPVDLPDGTVGWMDSLALDVELAGDDIWGALETETITIGDLKPSVPVPAYMPQHVVDTAAPDAITPGQPGRKIADLQPGDELVVSELVWERPAGGWLSLPGIAARSADMPEEHKHLAESLRLAYLPDQNVLVWVPGWAHLTQADLTVQPTTAEPTETATAEPAQDAVVPAVDPATIELDTTVQRRGARAGFPSRFTILAAASDSAPTRGHIAEGVVFRASAEFVGEDSTTHGNLWRAIEVDVDGQPTRAYVHADDVVELGDPAPTTAPAPTAGATEKLLDKASEKVEGIGDREGGGFGWHPFRDLSNRLAWAAAMIPLLAAFGLLSLGGYRAVVRASGKTPRAGLTVPGKILALAPTGAGVTAGLIAAWLLPSTTRLAWTTVVLLGLAAGGVVMARLCSARQSLYPTALTPMSCGIAAGAGLVVAAVVGLLLGWMPAVVAGLAAVGAGLAFTGRPANSEPETEQKSEPEGADATL